MLAFRRMARGLVLSVSCTLLTFFGAGQLQARIRFGSPFAFAGFVAVGAVADPVLAGRLVQQGTEGCQLLHDWCWVAPGAEKAMRAAVATALTPGK